MLIEKRDVQKLYNLPTKVIFCQKCTISNQRPRIIFNENNVCSACQYSEIKKKKIDWDLRDKELQKLCDKHRKNNGDFDVVVPCSGGKDGSFVAHQLKTQYGMKPLTCTWAPLVRSEIGVKNLNAFVESGFYHLLGTSNKEITRKLTSLCFKYLGDPFQPFIYGQTNFPLKVAVQNNISLIMYGENGEVEYGGDMKNANRPTRDLEDHIKHYFSGLDPTFWTKYGMNLKDLKEFMPPPKEDIYKNKTEIHFFGYYKFWDPQENFYYSIDNTNFTPNPDKTEGTYSKYASLDDELDGFHFYLAYIKFGIGRATQDSAHEIRDGKITREEGILLVNKFDGEFPKKYFKVFLDYCNISKKDFDEVIDSWRAEHIWSKNNKNEWFLKNKITK